ncbi:hypothetical protein SBA2_50006 [Acidobacteriia bacterium SbA2]|nr:hypothetical protein SBA2_50006 [Acidobacteriia bacterium SbA2]
MQKSPRLDDALSPLGERVARDGVFTSRRGSGEGVVVSWPPDSEESRPDLCSSIRRSRAGFLASLGMTV